MAPEMSVHVVLLGDDCHWYVIVPPPVAGVDVNATGVAPEAIDWLLPIVPALIEPDTVIVDSISNVSFEALHATIFITCVPAASDGIVHCNWSRAGVCSFPLIYHLRWPRELFNVKFTSPLILKEPPQNDCPLALCECISLI